jgi:DNA mismatch repair protein MutS2
MHSKGFTQENTLVLREGRLVIPMKEGSRGRVKGLIVDQSASGATVFMEPLEILEINNEIRRLQALETREIEKILKTLTDQVRKNLSDIEHNFMLAGRMDCLFARARFSILIQGIAAEISPGRNLHFKKVRHPLLLERMNYDDVIPLTLQMGESHKTLVITGPNAGGKTVALKTIGLLALMHQHGFHIPADQGTSLPLFSQVFADIGDRQSIQKDLSTFSSHISNLKKILDQSDAQSLVLLDEIGSATDPSEGAALAESVLQVLTQKGCLTIATTHMGALKVFAHETPGVENGSMIFDQKTLTPTYRFQMGIPGSSYAFEIAQRFGLLNKVINDARKRVGEERGKLDRLVVHLEEALNRSQILLKEAEIKETRLSGLIELYQERLETLTKSGDAKAQVIVNKAEALLKEVNTEVERVVKEIRESQANKKAIRQAKDVIKKRQNEVKNLLQVKEKTTQSLNKGDWVIWPGHFGKGIILSDPDSSGRVHVDWEGVTLRIPLVELFPVGEKQEKKESSGVSKYRLSSDLRNEVDLRGYVADEAVEALERYLGDASSSGLHYIRIIHGKGTGVLRQEVNRFLKGHPLVKSKRLGHWNEGDTGVTIVELK